MPKYLQKLGPNWPARATQDGPWKEGAEAASPILQAQALVFSKIMVMSTIYCLKCMMHTLALQTGGWSSTGWILLSTDLILNCASVLMCMWAFWESQGELTDKDFTSFLVSSGDSSTNGFSIRWRYSITMAA